MAGDIFFVTLFEVRVDTLIGNLCSPILGGYQGPFWCTGFSQGRFANAGWGHLTTNRVASFNEKTNLRI